MTLTTIFCRAFVLVIFRFMGIEKSFIINNLHSYGVIKA